MNTNSDIAALEREAEALRATIAAPTPEKARLEHIEREIARAKAPPAAPAIYSTRPEDYRKEIQRIEQGIAFRDRKRRDEEIRVLADLPRHSPLEHQRIALRNARLTPEFYAREDADELARLDVLRKQLAQLETETTEPPTAAE